MMLKPNKRTIGLLGGLVALIVLVVGTVLWFQNEALAAALERAQERRKTLGDSRSLAVQAEQARLDLDADRRQLQFLESGVPDAAYVPTLLRQLEELARATKNRVAAVRPILIVKAPTKIEQRRNPEAQAKAEAKPDDKKKEKKKEEPYTPYGIQVSLAGTYRSSQDFVDRLMKFPKILAVEEMGVRPHPVGAGVEEETDLLDIEIKLTAYIMKEGSPARDRTTTTARAASGGSAP